jgi:hypothetical protein
LDGLPFQEFGQSTHVQHPLSHRLVVAEMLLLRLTRRLVARRRQVQGLRLLRALPRPMRRRSVAHQVTIMQATIHCMSLHDLHWVLHDLHWVLHDLHLCTMPPDCMHGGCCSVRHDLAYVQRCCPRRDRGVSHVHSLLVIRTHTLTNNIALEHPRCSCPRCKWSRYKSWCPRCKWSRCHQGAHRRVSQPDARSSPHRRGQPRGKHALATRHCRRSQSSRVRQRAHSWGDQHPAVQQRGAGHCRHRLQAAWTVQRHSNWTWLRWAKARTHARRGARRGCCRGRRCSRVRVHLSHDILFSARGTHATQRVCKARSLPALGRSL